MSHERKLNLRQLYSVSCVDAVKRAPGKYYFWRGKRPLSDVALSFSPLLVLVPADIGDCCYAATVPCHFVSAVVGLGPPLFFAGLTYLNGVNRRVRESHASPPPLSRLTIAQKPTLLPLSCQSRATLNYDLLLFLRPLRFIFPNLWKEGFFN